MNYSGIDATLTHAGNEIKPTSYRVYMIDQNNHLWSVTGEDTSQLDLYSLFSFIKC